MVTVRDIITCLEAWAPADIQESWDNSGLCIGTPETLVTGVLLCLDCTPEVVDEAVACGANMIVSHHPLLFHGLKHLCDSTPQERTVAAALRAHVVVYSAHTNADKVMDGVSGAMAAALHLQETRVLEPASPMKDGRPCGLGLVGNLPAPVPVLDFMQQLKVVFSLTTLKASRPYHSVIERVALCGGAGSSLLEAVLDSGAQIYVSGDFSYHHYLDTEPRLILADIGHYESEVGVLPYFYNVLIKKFPTFAVRITQLVTNPVQYY